ncbi:putative intracellular serine protease protein [Rosellinia necatrix]|uniref:Putative intracellular serine protease protein n=1 Tax=Rosellinia necatrix TaxID=77044 RepID=A0A1S8A694_ROSNE|nr:putative intracellular serine protease protein [Rosellinia necatrix]
MEPGAGSNKSAVAGKIAEGTEDEGTRDDSPGKEDASSQKPPPEDSSQGGKPTLDDIPNGHGEYSKRPERRHTFRGKPTKATECDSSRTPYQENPNGTTKPGMSPTKESVEAIGTHLKHAYLRTENRQDSSLFLYGPAPLGNWMQVDFSLEGKGGEIDEADFEVGYECVKLEDTLKLLHIPRLAIKPKPPPQPKTEAYPTKPSDPLKPSDPVQALNSALGGANLSIIFNWLHNKKGINKIFELIVDDSHHMPHTDGQIVESVKRFDIEVWKWQKTDLCVEAITTAAPNAREIHLYWSGKNAVLRGWSDSSGDLEGGLAQFRQLMTVVIHPPAYGLEGGSQDDLNFELFQGRVKASARRLEGKEIKVTLASKGPPKRKSVQHHDRAAE